MKVVINVCYGGFGLSHAAMMLYGELSGTPFYPYVRPDRRVSKFVPFDKSQNFDVMSSNIYYFQQPLQEDKLVQDSISGAPVYDNDISRTDINLVAVVEKLGARANAQFAQLKVVEVPDDVKFYIDQYDGMEVIREVHREWC